MALFDKINTLAKTVGDKTNDAIEITKLNAKISSEKASLGETKKKIGDYYYAKHLAGEATDPEIAELLAKADTYSEAIRDAEAQIKALKAEGNVQSGETAEANYAPGRFCPNCGKENSAASRFCFECGAKIEE